MGQIVRCTTLHARDGIKDRRRFGPGRKNRVDQRAEDDTLSRRSAPGGAMPVAVSE